jgi:hypothetical protein
MGKYDKWVEKMIRQFKIWYFNRAIIVLTRDLNKVTDYRHASVLFEEIEYAKNKLKFL